MAVLFAQWSTSFCINQWRAHCIIWIPFRLQGSKERLRTLSAPVWQRDTLWSGFLSQSCRSSGTSPIYFQLSSYSVQYYGQCEVREEAVLSLWEIQVQPSLYLFLSKSLLSSLLEGLQVPHSAWWEPSLMSLYHFLLLSFFTLNGTCPSLPWDTKPHALALMVHRLQLRNYERCIRSFD